MNFSITNIEKCPNQSYSVRAFSLIQITAFNGSLGGRLLTRTNTPFCAVLRTNDGFLGLDFRLFLRLGAFYDGRFLGGEKDVATIYLDALVRPAAACFTGNIFSAKRTVSFKKIFEKHGVSAKIYRSFAIKRKKQRKYARIIVPKKIEREGGK